MQHGLGKTLQKLQKLSKSCKNSAKKLQNTAKECKTLQKPAKELQKTAKTCQNIAKHSKNLPKQCKTGFWGSPDGLLVAPRGGPAGWAGLGWLGWLGWLLSHPTDKAGWVGGWVVAAGSWQVVCNRISLVARKFQRIIFSKPCNTGSTWTT